MAGVDVKIGSIGHKGAPCTLIIFEPHEHGCSLSFVHLSRPVPLTRERRRLDLRIRHSSFCRSYCVPLCNVVWMQVLTPGQVLYVPAGMQAHMKCGREVGAAV
eukprot:2718510-Pleurochrysis_carterae.AAC.3